MKPNKLLLATGLIAVSMLGFSSCGDDDDWGQVDGLAPTMNLTSTHIKTATGRTFTISGNLADNDGISTINLYCPELYLNKTIDIIDIYGEPLKTYDLNYSFPISAKETGDNFNVVVTVTDVVNQKQTGTVLITMDGDFENPAFSAAPGSEVTLIMKARTTYNLNVSVSDDQALDYMTVQIPGIEPYDQPVTISCNGAKSYQYADKVTFPNVENSYKLFLTVVDKEGKKTTSESTISVTSQVPDYPNLWLADVATAEELNADIFGVPQYVDHALTAEGDSIPYTYVARYYNQKAGTKVWFLGQKTDFSPICYGCDATDNTLLSDDEETMQPITLTEAGVYYRITIDIKTYSMTTETYPISEALSATRVDLYNTAAFDVWGDGGSWLYNFSFGYLNSGPSGVISFAQDATNPNLFYLEEPLQFDADNNLSSSDDGYTTNFIIHNFHPGGWWDVVCWKPNSKEDPEFWPWWGNNSQLTTEGWQDWPGYQVVRSQGDKWSKVPVPSNKFGQYRLWFDAHLERAKLVPAK